LQASFHIQVKTGTDISAKTRTARFWGGTLWQFAWDSTEFLLRVEYTGSCSLLSISIWINPVGWWCRLFKLTTYYYGWSRFDKIEEPTAGARYWSSNRRRRTCKIRV